MHAQIKNKTHSLANLQDLIPTLARPIIIIMSAKVGIKSSRFFKECVSFMHAWIGVTIQLKMCLDEQTQIVANAVCRVDSQQFLS